MMTRLVTVFCLGAALAACDMGPKSAVGFRLPDGDAVRGEQSFLSLGCHSCHSVANFETPEPLTVGPVNVLLGGQVVRVKTYGELVSSVINPSHRIAPGSGPDAVTEQGESVMRVYNDTMTVQQLIDLVAFLQSHYEVVPPEFHYPRYGY
ncbi:MAG: c-type cytochrome [Gammaproteobacteria bacterium]